MRLSYLIKYVLKAVSAIVLGLSLVPAANAINIDSKVFNFQKKLAIAGKYKAQYKLALMYETGRGVEKDLVKAGLWYKKASHQNFKAAKHRLIYLDIKKGGFKSKHKAWIRALNADAASDPEAMFLMAELYENGIGVKKSLKLTRKFYQSSAAKGHADAEARLFVLSQKIRKQEQMAQIQAEEKRTKQLAEEKKKKAAQRKKAAERLAKNKAQQLKEERKKNRLIAESKKRKLEQKRKLQAKKKAEKEDKQVVAKVKTEEEFESDLCSGAAARFRTQCN